MKNKTILTILSLLLTAGLVPAAVSEAERLNRNLLYAEEETYVADIASYQGQLYTLRYEGLFAYDARTGKEKLVTDAVTSNYEQENYIGMLAAGENGLYGLRINQRELICLLDERGDYAGDIAFSWEGEEDFVSGAFLQEGRLYLATYDTSGEVLRGISHSGAEDSRTPMPDILCIAPYKEGKALAAARVREGNKLRHVLCLITLGSGEREELEELSFRPGALAWDADGDRILMTGEGRLYSRGMGGSAELSAYILSGDVARLAALGGGISAALVDSNIAIRARGSAGEQKRLVLGRQYGRSADYAGFLKERPDIELLFQSDALMTPEEQFTNDMITRSGETDIYILTDPNLLSTIYEKGFGADLSQSIKLSGTMNDMHLPFQRLFLRDGVIRAMPLDVNIDVLGYDPVLFERMNLSVPADYTQLLDVLELWLNEYADEYPEISFDPFTEGVKLSKLLEQYADECAVAGVDVTYSTPEMEELLSRFIDISTAYADRRERRQNEEKAFYTISLMYKGAFDYLPLSVHRASTPIISGADIEMAYYVINPFSNRQDDARQFIEYAVDAWPQEVSFSLLRSMARPVEWEGYEKEKQRVNDDLAEIETARAKAEAIDLPAFDLQIQRKQDELALAEINRWVVTQEQANRYKELVDNIAINDKNPLSILADKQAEFFDQVTALQPGEFLRQLDERVRLVKMEGR